MYQVAKLFTNVPTYGFLDSTIEEGATRRFEEHIHTYTPCCRYIMPAVFYSIAEHTISIKSNTVTQNDTGVTTCNA